ncbi:MAG: type 4a pilus biogenesis protein PilO [Actinobacteria bacterium]|nr:type 4a pilus biogenesis protein PilO [Actinomycetota bacterium]
MRNSYKIVLIIALIVLTALAILLIAKPVLQRCINSMVKIEEEKVRYEELNSEIDTYLDARDDYYLLNAEQQKLSMELPGKSDISIITNELYEVARYTDIEISSINFEEIKIDEKELKKEPVKEIEIEMVLKGSYYEILNYINTVEIIPRIIKIEDVIIQVNTPDDFENLLAFVVAKTYYDNEHFQQIQ